MDIIRNGGGEVEGWIIIAVIVGGHRRGFVHPAGNIGGYIGLVAQVDGIIGTKYQHIGTIRIASYIPFGIRKSIHSRYKEIVGGGIVGIIAEIPDGSATEYGEIEKTRDL